MIDSILTVCTGNICRSPMAELLLAQSFHDAGLRVASAGTHALRGYPADELAQQQMQALGCDLSAHRARQLNREMVQDFALILVMEQAHAEWIFQQWPMLRGRVQLMSQWLPDVAEVPDPYRRGEQAFAECRELLQRAVDSWRQRLA